MLLNDPTHSYYPPPAAPVVVSTHPPLSSPNFLCSSVRIRNLILDQLHIRNLVSTGYTAGDTGLGIGGVCEVADTRGILRGCLGEERQKSARAGRAGRRNRQAYKLAQLWSSITTIKCDIVPTVLSLPSSSSCFSLHALSCAFHEYSPSAQRSEVFLRSTMTPRERTRYD